MSEFHQIEGVILRSFNYKEKQKILSVFTKDGILSFITYVSKNKASGALCEPTSCVNFTYSKSRSDLLKVKEINLINAHISLRNNYEKIESASNILRSLVKSQLPGKPSPLLYQLTKVYLKQLCKSIYPKGIEISFLLKLMRHEGLLSFEKDSPFTNEETILVKALTFTKDFSLLEEIHLDGIFTGKVENLFNETVNV